MTGIHIEHVDSIGQVINYEGGQINVATASAEHLVEVLVESVLTAKDATSARRLAKDFDELLAARQDVTADQVRTGAEHTLENTEQAPDRSVREALMQLGTGTAAGVLSQGVVLALGSVFGS